MPCCSGRSTPFGMVDALFAVLLSHQLADDIRNCNPSIGKAHAPGFSGAQHHAGESSPFLAIVIRAMVRHHDAQAQKAGKRRHQGRADGLDVQDVRPVHRRVDYAKESVHDGFQAFRARRPQDMEVHIAPAFTHLRRLIRRAHDDRHLATEFGQLRTQVLGMGFHAALDTGESAQAQPHDPDRFFHARTPMSP